MTLEEAKVIAMLGDAAPIGRVQKALFTILSAYEALLNDKHNEPAPMSIIDTDRPNAVYRSWRPGLDTIG